jgi:hypothetical protein
VSSLAEGGLVRREPQVGPAFEALELVAQAEGAEAVAAELRHLPRARGCGRSERCRAAAWDLGPRGVRRGALIWASVVSCEFGGGGASGGSEEVWNGVFENWGLGPLHL